MNHKQAASREAIRKSMKALISQNKYDARNYAFLAVQLAPDWEEAWLMLAAVASSRASVAYVEEALKINPNSLRAKRALDWAIGRLHKDTKKIPVAVSSSQLHQTEKLDRVLPTKKRRVSYPVIVGGILLLGLLISSLLFYQEWRKHDILFIGGNSYQEGYGLYRQNLLYGKPTYLASAHELSSPRWSPDGGQIAFVLSENHRPPYQIAVMNANGRDRRQLTSGLVRCYDPAWSPDGKQIVFVKASEYEGGSPNALFIINGDGTELKQLTPYAYYSYPSWSPDGSQIVFSNYHGLATINSDGSGYQLLTENMTGYYYLAPAWSHDGEYIAFSAVDNTSPGAFFDLYVMRADGSDVRQLTSAPAHDRFPSWSPDNKKIIFDSNFESEDVAIDYVYQINVDGTGFERLVEMQSRRPDWRP
jgi:TolB protein